MSRGGRIDSGARNRRYIIEKGIVTRGTDGSVLKTWVEQATIWGAYKQLKGDELAFARQLSATASATITVPYRSDITTDLRLTSGGRVWHIDDVDDGDRWENELVLTVTELTES